jgi:hypothetical protein
VVVTSRLCLDRLRTRRRYPTDALDVVDDLLDPQAPQVFFADQIGLDDSTFGSVRVAANCLGAYRSGARSQRTPPCAPT